MNFDVIDRGLQRTNHNDLTMLNHGVLTAYKLKTISVVNAHFWACNSQF